MKHVGIKAILMAMVFPLLLSCARFNENASTSYDPNINSGETYNPELDTEKREEVISKVLFGFNTTYTIKLWNAPRTAALGIIDVIDKLNALSDSYNEIKGINNVWTINHSQAPVEIDPMLFKLLEKSLEYKKQTDGYFDPLMGKISKLWKDYLNVETGPMIPSDEIIQPLLKEAKNSELILNKRTMTAQVIGGAEIDLGAVAKGYSLKLIKEILDFRNVKEYLINGGDSAIALGKKPVKVDFSIGMKDIPKAYFLSHDEMISTSSMFEQGKIINGVKYNHIVNPFTGSAKTNFDLVLVKGPLDPGLLDCMSTAFSCMSLDDIKAYEHIFDIDILVYDEDEILYQSKNMEVRYH